MVNFKRVLSSILILTISLLIGCTKINENTEANIDLFDVFKGKELATNYLINIRNGDIAKANKLSENVQIGVADEYIAVVDVIISEEIGRASCRERV